MWTICRKELADHFSSIRFLILLCLILMVALVSTYMDATNVREALEGLSKLSQVFLLLFTTPGKFFSLVQFIAFFGPLLGIIMGFISIAYASFWPGLAILFSIRFRSLATSARAAVALWTSESFSCQWRWKGE